MGTPRQSCIVICGNCGCRQESSDEGTDCGRSWNDRAAPAPPQGMADGRAVALRNALWVLTEHNALHFGEAHNTVIQGRAALAASPAQAPRPPIEQERAAAEFEYSVTAYNFPEAPIGSRDWTLYWAGWLARSTNGIAAAQASTATAEKASKGGGNA